MWKEKRKVLIVDDDLVIRSSMHDILTDREFLVSGAKNGDDALEMLRLSYLPASVPYSLAIINLGLRGRLTTIELLKEIRDEYGQKLPILVSAEPSDYARLNEAEKLRITGSIPLPFTAEDIDRELAHLFSPPKNPTHGPAILIIEDDPDLSNVLLQALKDEGCQAASVSTSRDAVFKLANQKFDCVILDMVLKRGYGADLIPALQTHWKEHRVPVRHTGTKSDFVPVIVASGSLNAPLVEQLAPHIVAAFVKPYEIRKVVQKAISLIPGSSRSGPETEEAA